MESKRCFFFVAHLEKKQVWGSMFVFGGVSTSSLVFCAHGTGNMVVLQAVGCFIPSNSFETTACGKLFRKQSHIP